MHHKQKETQGWHEEKHVAILVEIEKAFGKTQGSLMIKKLLVN